MEMVHDVVESGPAASVAGGRSAEREIQAFETAAQAVACLEQRHGKRSQQWAYWDAQGDPVGLIVRWDAPEGKEIRPVSRRPRGDWVIGGMPEPRPLYELPSLLARPEEPVYVTEGEKAADAAGWLGLLATTSPHGSGSAGKADWRALAGRDVVILPDNDDAGRQYAQTVASILHNLSPRPRVKVVELPNLPPKGDLYDWLTSCPVEQLQERRTLLQKLAHSADAWRLPVREEKTPTACVAAHAPVLQCFFDVVPTSVRWLWPGRIPLGRITLLVGRPGEGKSFLTTDLAARVSTGKPWPDGSESVSGSVIFICAGGEPADTLHPRLDCHGADVRLVHLLEKLRRSAPDGQWYDASFTLENAKVLESCLQTHPDCRLIVVDPIGSYLGSGTDSYRDSDVRAILDPVTRLADLYGPAVLLVAHRRKDGGTTHADDLALGSRAFTGVARSVWHLTRDRQNKSRRLLLPGKNNLDKEGQGLAFTIAGSPPAICWEPGPVDLTANEALAAESASDKASADSPVRRTTVEWLHELLANGPMAAAEVRREADNAGLAWRTVHRAKDSLGIRPVRASMDGPWVWRLPAESDKGGH